jgi:hypothetical protein
MLLVEHVLAGLSPTVRARGELILLGPVQNKVFVNRQEIQPTAKKNVRFT